MRASLPTAQPALTRRNSRKGLRLNLAPRTARRFPAALLIAVASISAAHLSAAPEHAAGYAEALKLYESGKYAESMEVIRRSVTPTYKAFELRMLAAAVYARMGKPANAIEHMIWCAKEHPKRHEPRVFLVSLYRSVGKYQEAIGVAKKAIQDTGDKAELRIELARLYYALGQYERTREQTAAALKFDSRNSEAVMLDGLSFLRQGKLENAEFRLQQALHLRPATKERLARTYNNLGLCYELRARRLPPEQNETARRYLKEADRHYRFAIQTMPGFAPAKVNLARISGGG